MKAREAIASIYHKKSIAELQASGEVWSAAPPMEDDESKAAEGTRKEKEAKNKAEWEAGRAERRKMYEQKLQANLADRAAEEASKKAEEEQKATEEAAEEYAARADEEETADNEQKL